MRLNVARLPRSLVAPESLRVLRWLAIALPISALVAADLVRGALFPESLHSVPARLILYGGTAATVFVFAWLIFGVVQTLQESLSEKNRQLEALSSVTAAAAEKVELEALLSEGLDRALDAVGADAGLICLVDRERREHSAVCIRGFSDEFAERVRHAKLSDDPVATRVVDTGRPVIVERVESDPLVAESAGREGIVSFVSAPLIAGGDVQGILVLASKSEREFTAIDREFIDGLGGHLGIVIRNGVLYDEAQHRARDLSALLAVGNAVASSLELDEVIESSLNTITSVTGAESAEIWLLEEGQLRLGRRVGPDAEEFLEQPTLGVGEGLPGIALQRSETVVEHDLAADERFVRRGVVAKGYRTYCAVPVHFHGSVVAVLGIAARSAEALTDAEELRLLEGIAEQIAPAIENAKLYGQVQDSAVMQERERIAREMHDGLGQVLGYVNTQTQAARKLIADGRTPEAADELEKLGRAARGLHAEVRESILGLRMAPGPDRDLIETFSEYLDGFRDIWGVDVKLEASTEACTVRLAPSAEIQLIRIVQEALTNVRKHADAESVVVSVGSTGAGLRVEVADDGRGFTPGAVDGEGTRHFGLQTMRERVESCGGTFELNSRPGNGTSVVFQLPALDQARETRS